MHTFPNLLTLWSIGHVFEETKKLSGRAAKQSIRARNELAMSLWGGGGGGGGCSLTNGYLPTLIFRAFGCERYLYGARLLITLFGVLVCKRPNILTRGFRCVFQLQWGTWYNVFRRLWSCFSMINDNHNLIFRGLRVSERWIYNRRLPGYETPCFGIHVYLPTFRMKLVGSSET